MNMGLQMMNLLFASGLTDFFVKDAKMKMVVMKKVGFVLEPLLLVIEGGLWFHQPAVTIKPLSSTLVGHCPLQVYCVGNMKVSGFFALLLVVGATLMSFNFLIPTSASGSPGTNYGDKATQIAVNRKLKENGNKVESGISNNGDMSEVILTDYNGVDPPPNSRAKASLYPDPIQHGSPLIPNIPKPSPPEDSD
ncbi:hypothetical protein V8G54_037662 [Vigna mungo]|uniref:Uncharacterized protein n=1 Tax=Vigna mungo TaxID=3915 RepID=A0AAQ3RED4_VIGMU